MPGGFEHFQLLFSFNSFYEVFFNTLILSFYNIIFGFPAPILLAILINEIMNRRFKKIVQTISYLPHFVSWVVLAGVFMNFLSPSTGPINILFMKLGLKPIFFFADTSVFRGLLVFTNIYKEIGWGSIIYIAALVGINSELYEAARIDGAKRLKLIWHITIPCLMPIITIMFIMRIGRILQDNFDQVFNMYNSSVYKVADVISTYTYRKGLEQMQYSFASAVGLFKNVIGLILLIVTNTITKRISEYGLW